MALTRWSLAGLCIALAFGAGCGRHMPAQHEGGAMVGIQATPRPPVIDGMLTDECWAGVEPVSLVAIADGGVPRYPTTFRAAYNSTYLYVGFECQDPDAASTLTAHDARLSGEDCVALFLDVRSDSTTYYAIEVAPTGAVLDAYVLTGRGGDDFRILSSWECENLRVSASVYGGGARPGTEDRFWTVEMAIPFSELLTAPSLPPSPGDTWRFNACRIDVAESRTLTAVAPTGVEALHRPRSFVRCVFR